MYLNLRGKSKRYLKSFEVDIDIAFKNSFYYSESIYIDDADFMEHALESGIIILPPGIISILYNLLDPLLFT